MAAPGLSPLARGTRFNPPCSGGFLRFIPAGAGNSKRWMGRGYFSAVYPRWRGELVHQRHARIFHLGLSPLARGTPTCRSRGNRGPRFIPAGAGNSRCCNSAANNFAVYPRWRGELATASTRGLSAFGLSPLARGTHRRSSVALAQPRFIPAGAGNSLQISANSCPWAVYPRWRGELKSSIFFPITGTGLSPLARGTHELGETLSIQIRFIPAGAGNSIALDQSKSAHSVYPRWRGELAASGLLNRLIIRFIPAGAGNSE